MFNSLSPSEYLHTNDLAAAYAAAQANQADWQNKIFHSESATSLGHCLALCRVATFSGSAGTYDCNMLSYDGGTSTCYLGDNDKDTPTVTVPTGVSTVYLDRGANISSEY